MDRNEQRNRSFSSHNNYDLSADLARIKDALADATYNAKGRANEMFTESIQSAKQKTTNLQNETAKYIAEKPFKTLGIAALTGFILGYLFRSK